MRRISFFFLLFFLLGLAGAVAAACGGTAIPAGQDGPSGAACGAATCQSGEVCCNVANPDGTCAPFCVGGAACPAVSCRSSCACPTGQICCESPTGAGVCAEQCLAATTCPGVACTLPPPDAGADAAADAPSGCPSDICGVCGGTCTSPGLKCPNHGPCSSFPAPSEADCVTGPNGVSTWQCVYPDAGPCTAPQCPDAGSCTPAGSPPPWSGGCPDTTAPRGGCAAGTTCVFLSYANVNKAIGCAPIPSSCAGNPTCACMGTCLCGSQYPYCGDRSGGSIDCSNGTVSRREFKDDIAYVEADERAELAKQALETRLARYRYKTEPVESPRHLGFIIDDLPDPSPAVQGDRTHVDVYGYTSMLLAALQEQSVEVRALRERVESLERAEREPRACSAPTGGPRRTAP